MKQSDVRFDLKVFAFVTASFAVLIAMTSTSLAQDTGGGQIIPSTTVRTTPSAAERAAAAANMREREWNLRHIGDNTKKTFERTQVSLFAQIKEDFWRLQIINNEVFYPVLDKSNFAAEDNKRIGEAMREVRKRAGRLKTNLQLPVPEKVKNNQQEITNEEVKFSLAMLNKTIISFVTNPLFQKPEVLNMEQNAQAGRDLNTIIKLSDAIQKRFKALTQSAQSQ